MDELAGLVSSLHDHLQATAERPVETEASRLLGEAQSIAEDLDGADPDRETVHDRIETVLDLLAEIDETGDKEAEEHVAAARRAGERALER